MLIDLLESSKAIGLCPMGNYILCNPSHRISQVIKVALSQKATRTLRIATNGDDRICSYSPLGLKQS